VPGGELDAARLRFLTRVHYWAADVRTHGPAAPWGEHEIDYLLLYRLRPGEHLTLRPNPEEVQAVRWLSREELRAAMGGGGGALALEMPLWAPWFRVIAGRFLELWWGDLDAAITTDRYVDVATIHRFDAGPDHHGGAGLAWPHLDDLAAGEAQARKAGDEAKRRALVLAAERDDRVAGFVGRGALKVKSAAESVKQGAYGKVPTHSSSKLDQLLRPAEVLAALRLKFGSLIEDNIKRGGQDEDTLFCDEMLGKVSRSFAAVIRQLPEGLCLDICVFYLVLRALDTVEDDMEAYRGREAAKEGELRSFGAKRLTDPHCSIQGVGAGDERALVERFGAVVRVLEALPTSSQAVIRDITDRMGNGMADYVSADLAQGTIDQAAYDRYCHMVAGLVGEGLTRIFVGRGVEGQSLCGQGEHVWPFCADARKEPLNFGLANSMGLFLQKTNIIRDYLEDYVDGRAFWPQSVWRRHATTGDLGEFARPTAHGAGSVLPVSSSWGSTVAKGVGVQALHCLDELIADALELVPDCLEYLARLQDGATYRFCAIPQVMAMATLAECFDNPKLFTGVVKIRKGLTARLICACVEGHDAVQWWFAHFARGISAAASSADCTTAGSTTAKRVVTACGRISERTWERAAAHEARNAQSARRALAAVSFGIAAVASLLLGRSGGA